MEPLESKLHSKLGLSNHDSLERKALLDLLEALAVHRSLLSKEEADLARVEDEIEEMALLEAEQEESLAEEFNDFWYQEELARAAHVLAVPQHMWQHDSILQSAEEAQKAAQEASNAVRTKVSGLQPSLASPTEQPRRLQRECGSARAQESLGSLAEDQ